MKVRIHYSRCMSTGVCVKIAPAVFQFDPKHKVQVLGSSVNEADKEAVLKAAARCPRQAVIVDANG